MASRFKNFHHIGRKSLRCPFPDCPKTFATQYGLTQHIRHSLKHQAVEPASPPYSPGNTDSAPVSPNGSPISQADPELRGNNFDFYANNELWDIDFSFDESDADPAFIDEVVNSSEWLF